MKRIFLLILLCLLLIPFNVAISQKYVNQFGMITNAELEMKAYEPDREAEAVVIYNLGDSRFLDDPYGGLEIHFLKRIRIKIFNKSGYRFGEIEIPYYKENVVSILKAATFNMEEGKIKRYDYDPKAVYKEKLNDNWNNLRLALPNIRDGSVIEYEYELITKDKFNLPGWDFQLTIPVIHSEYDVRMVPYYSYQFILQGADKFSSTEKYSDTYNKRYFGQQSFYEDVYKFIMTNLPAFRDEAYITNMRDYQIRMDFQLSTFHSTDGATTNLVSTWTSLNDELLKDLDFGKYINSSAKEAEKFLSTIDFTGLDDVQKIEKISDAVKMNFKWDGDERKFATKSPKEFLKQKTGNSAEINLFLLSCLKVMNIEAYPVLLSTRDHGKIKVNYPFLHFFNNAIVLAKVNDKAFLLDATDPFLPFDKIPLNCINESGLIVEKKSEKWVNLSSSDQISSVYEKFDFFIKPEKNEIDCKIRIVSNGYEASGLKQKTGIKYENIKEELVSRGLNPDDSIIIKNFIERKQDYTIEFMTHPKMEQIEGNIIISPFIQEAMQENNLKSPARVYPVDFIYRKNRQFETTITIPPGYKPGYIPPNYNINNDYFNIVYITRMTDSTLNVNGKYELKKSIYNAKDYLALKTLFSEIVNRFNDKIVLEKAK